MNAYKVFFSVSHLHDLRYKSVRNIPEVYSLGVCAIDDINGRIPVWVRILMHFIKCMNNAALRNIQILTFYGNSFSTRHIKKSFSQMC